MLTSDFDYALPPELIAQSPPVERTRARMLVVDRATGALSHRGVADILDYLAPGDVLVINDTRVIPARLFGRRGDTGGRVEVLLLEPVAGGRWVALYRAAGRPRAGLAVELAGGHVRAQVATVLGGGRVELELATERPLLDVLAEHGVPPLPPYIRRDAATPPAEEDRERYQTVYARHPGAVAAPTAGLHFTRELLAAVEARGVSVARITLHVGPGTFKPVKAEQVVDHRMEAERYTVSAEAAAAINRARAGGGRVVAVGSTTVRTLETVARDHGALVACEGRSELFIHPPYAFRIVDRMLTNFHLPRSTLLMMVSAFVTAGLPAGGPDAVSTGHNRLLAAYAEAIRQRYRFYSYGDCMLLL